MLERIKQFVIMLKVPEIQPFEKNAFFADGALIKQRPLYFEDHPAHSKSSCIVRGHCTGSSWKSSRSSNPQWFCPSFLMQSLSSLFSTRLSESLASSEASLESIAFSCSPRFCTIGILLAHVSNLAERVLRARVASSRDSRLVFASLFFGGIQVIDRWTKVVTAPGHELGYSNQLCAQRMLDRRGSVPALTAARTELFRVCASNSRHSKPLSRLYSIYLFSVVNKKLHVCCVQVKNNHKKVVHCVFNPLVTSRPYRDALSILT